MSLLSRLFGGGPGKEPAAQPDPDHYNGYDIFPEPIREGPHWRIAARIEREVDGEVKSHYLVRADTLGEQEAAAAESVVKARRLIDEQGDGIFETS
ncbi:HlyU family transcriptional regulator [Roseovarius sp. SYSU LYC5161]|uniref:HlyU family transcriptional regulator n=1 Tax=Roseovarius halophilus (ex Wu et al. 2025) TaxID=3376060 RepID=UPI00287120F2|nr:HlyU family transcriptional regulator [Roseovarius sp.]